jgi:hypothetical protein
VCEPCVSRHSSQWTCAAPKPLLALTRCVAVVVLAFPVAHAQVPAGPGGMGRGGMMQRMGMMQQMGATMKQMSEMMGAK